MYCKRRHKSFMAKLDFMGKEQENKISIQKRSSGDTKDAETPIATQGMLEYVRYHRKGRGFSRFDPTPLITTLFYLRI